MITKTEFVQRVIKKLMEYRSMLGVQIYFDDLHEDNLVVAAIPKDGCIYLQGPSSVRYIALTYNDFIGQKYEEIISRFIVITTINWMEMAFKRKK